MATSSESRRAAYLTVIVFLCILATAFVGAGIGLVFAHPDMFANAITLFTMGSALIPVAIISKRQIPKDESTAEAPAKKVDDVLVE